MTVDGQLVLGRFRALRLLAEQSAFQEFLGVDERREGSSSAVVIRLYREPMGRGSSPCHVALLERLAVVSQMRQRGIASLLDFGQFAGRLVLVSAHKPGSPLSDLAAEKNSRVGLLTPDMAVAIVRALSESLQKLRDNFGADALHGRISLGSIYLPQGQEPQLDGLGIAAIEDAASEAEARVRGMQQAVSYAAPEVVQGSRPDEAADVYGLTLVLYQLLSGSNPFLGRTVSETLRRVMVLVPPKLTLASHPTGHVLNEVLLRGMDKDPACRFSSLGELAVSLGKCVSAPNVDLLAALDILVREQPWTPWQTSLESHAQLLLEESDTEPEFRPIAAIAGVPVDSGFPAFASGLLTEQPRSVSEHTHAHTRQVRPLKRLRNGMAVAVPAVALLVGLVLGRAEHRSGESLVANSATSPIGDTSWAADPVETLRLQVKNCTRLSEIASDDARLVLQLDPRGQVASVAVLPENWAQTRAGTCALKAARNSAVLIPGAASLIVPVNKSAQAAQ